MSVSGRSVALSQAVEYGRMSHPQKDGKAHPDENTKDSLFYVFGGCRKGQWMVKMVQWSSGPSVFPEDTTFGS